MEDVEEEVIEAIGKVRQLLNHPMTVPVGVGVVSLGVGVGIGYILSRRKKYEAVIEVEHEDPNQMKLDFNSDALAEQLATVQRYLETEHTKPVITEEEVVEVDVTVDVDDILEDEEPEVIEREDSGVDDFVAQRLKDSMTSSHTASPEEQPVVTSSIFANNDDDWNYDEELAKRNNVAPYIIHADEFFADEKDYTQMSLTYFAGDEILADEEDSPIYNHSQVVGDLKFGHGSNDPNVVYIRNDKRRAEYEILLHEGLFSEEVLGLEIENNHRRSDLRHSADRKFRQVE